jgi:hypothetical protein
MIVDGRRVYSDFNKLAKPAAKGLEESQDSTRYSVPVGRQNGVVLDGMRYLTVFK